MSYYVEQRENDFFIDKKHHGDVIKAVQENFASKDFSKPVSIEQVFEEFGFEIGTDSNGSIHALEFGYGSCSEIDDLFPVIAPYVKAGSYIEFAGESYNIYRVVFDGTTCKEIPATITFEEDNDATC